VEIEIPPSNEIGARLLSGPFWSPSDCPVVGPIAEVVSPDFCGCER